MLHRQIMGEPDGAIVDHRNGDTLDNRRCNLRIATTFENAHNSRKKRGSCTSRYKGVWWSAKQMCWNAMIMNRGNSSWLGSFQDEVAAGQAYDNAARDLHGRFACVNFPREGERSAI